MHDDFDNPLDLQAFRSNSTTPKKVQHESLSDALTGAAVEFAHASKSHNAQNTSEPHQLPVAAVGVSPGKAVELRMKNFEQLCYLQQLYEDGVLTTRV